MSERTSTSDSPWVSRVYDAKNSDELKGIYEDWAGTFDSDMGTLGYVAPKLTVDAVVAAHGRLDGRILDAGCGTGLCGVALQQAGAQTIDGVDLSSGMLDVARKTGVYKDLSVADLNKSLDKADETYDVLTCVGTLTHGHVGPTPALPEFVRVLRRGGILAVTVVNAIWVSGGFEAEVKKLEQDELVEVLDTAEADYRTKGGAKARIVVLKKK